MEVMQKISDKPLSRHAKCGGKLTKEWSRTGFQFKGTGWYVTDYAGKKSEAKDGGESKSEAGVESKPAAAEPKGESKTKGGKKSAGAPGAGGD
jgi:predicted nucleic acid-binding Zn ribbon protein